MKYIEPFGKWLKERRKALDLTQRDLADQVGCAEITVRKMEANDYRPSKQIAARLGDALVIAPEERDAFMRFARGRHDALPTLDLSTLTLSHNLPPASTPFIGRTSELAEISTRLADPKCRLLSLVGPGGIGKTRLALQAVADQIGNFAHGVYFVALTSVSTQSMIAAVIASEVQISFYGSETINTQVINHLRGKQILLILDNFEHLLEGTNLLVEMLEQAPKLKLIVTTREKLNIQEEWSLLVEGLTVPERDNFNEANTYDSVKLFGQSALRVQPAFALQPNLDSVIEICQAVEGMPLGIELAASWLRAMSCQQIVGYIRSDLNFLTSPLRNLPARQRSLRTVFDHSWQLLSSVEREVLSRLTVFRGGFDLEAAAHAAFATLLTLASLVDKSMIRLRESGRYEIHELLRQYGSEKLTECGETSATRQHHLEYFVALAEKLEEYMFGSSHLTVCNRLEDEHNNIRTALEWAVESHQIALGLQLAGAVGWFWIYRGYWSEGIGWLETFLNSSDTSIATRAKALRHLIQIMHDNGIEFERISDLTTTLVSLVPQLKDPKLIAWIYSTTGLVKYPDLDQCEMYLERGLMQFRQLEDIWGICWSLNMLAQKLFQRGVFMRAGELQDEGIKLARTAGDKSILCTLLQLKACKNWFQFPGQIEHQSIDLYYESLSLYQELGYTFPLATLLFQLGKVEQLKHNPEQARNLYEKSLLLAERVGSKWYVITSLVALSELFCILNEPVRGARILGSITPTVNQIFVGAGFSLEEAKEHYARAKAAGEAELGDAFQPIFAEAMLLTLDWAIAAALEKPEFSGRQQLPSGSKR